MSFSINDIRATLQLDGARPSQFMVEIQNPFNGSAALKTPFLVRAASIPASTVGQVEVPYFGRTIKLAGERSYDNWSVSVINDEDFIVRDALEEWHAAINSPEGNLRREPGLTYKSTALVTQFAKTGEQIRKYKFNGIFPINISDIQLNWGAANQLEEFSVTFAVDTWNVVPGPTGDAGGTL